MQPDAAPLNQRTQRQRLAARVNPVDPPVNLVDSPAVIDIPAGSVGFPADLHGIGRTKLLAAATPLLNRYVRENAWVVDDDLLSAGKKVELVEALMREKRLRAASRL